MVQTIPAQDINIRDLIETPKYARSNIFATYNQGDLYRVFQILRYLSPIVINR
ncbi:MAG: hypothetical protein SWJ54_01675 [Cyanobacteriota bacterium]|nr:hypothetical protein [Cyanobacteriota bacterium]